MVGTTFFRVYFVKRRNKISLIQGGIVSKFQKSLVMAMLVLGVCNSMSLFASENELDFEKNTIPEPRFFGQPTSEEINAYAKLMRRTGSQGVDVFDMSFFSPEKCSGPIASYSGSLSQLIEDENFNLRVKKEKNGRIKLIIEPTQKKSPCSIEWIKTCCDWRYFFCSLWCCCMRKNEKRHSE